MASCRFRNSRHALSCVCYVVLHFLTLIIASYACFARAFNFADNQILRPYGLEHVTLNSSRLHPINVTTKALKAARKSEQYRLARAGAEKEGQAANEQVNHESTIGV